ncbi:hypothetical protein NPIL_640241 [Nephila pilipes]|uniref:Uncharacterized protein n=1 Tax=Nephila pilipes TaxID=299642 RepID=A0A8X6NUN6_NEPPI|nr:hypothetical protein NPIL_640241 [Nephila pilipes]
MDRYISYDNTDQTLVPRHFPNELHSYNHFAPRATVGSRREITCTETHCYPILNFNTFLGDHFSETRNEFCVSKRPQKHSPTHTPQLVPMLCSAGSIH